MIQQCLPQIGFESWTCTNRCLARLHGKASSFISLTMPGSLRPDRNGAAELTLKFRKKNEDLVIAFLPKSPWVQLLPQRSPPPRDVLKINTVTQMVPALDVSEESGLKYPHKATSLSEKGNESGNRTKSSPENSPTSSSINPDGFHKLHALCSSPTSSIEMIRMWVELLLRSNSAQSDI